MIVAIAWKSLRTHPVRTLVLGVGFGLGVSVMATLLGVGEVVLEQARTPTLVGGGDLIVTGASGTLTSARFVVSRITAGDASAIVSPRLRKRLVLTMPDGRSRPVVAHGSIPSRERALAHPEVADLPVWTDTSRDQQWVVPDLPAVLRAMDRFRPVPDVPRRAKSWAEWLYFKGQSGTLQFYLTFLAGPTRDDGRRVVGVRLQLNRNGEVSTYAAQDAIDEPTLIRTAPEIAVGAARVRLDGLRYLISFDLPRTDGRTGAARGEIAMAAVPGRSLPPIELKGNAGWVSGYTVPVMSGPLSGSIVTESGPESLSGVGYHDHNWGFWEGVSWRWGQVAHDGLSYLYGRVIPPPDAADPDRVPGFLVAFGPDGPVGFATRVSIDEIDDPATRQPTRIVVDGHGQDLNLRLELAIEDVIVNRRGALALGPDFLQMRARYRVTGTAGQRQVDFSELGAAETFRD